MRSVGGRAPTPTRSTSTSSSAMFSNGGRATAGSSFHGNACQRAASSAASADASVVIVSFGVSASSQGADDGHRQRFRRRSDQLGAGSERVADSHRVAGFVERGGAVLERSSEQRERFLRVEEEIAGDDHIAKLAVYEVELNRDELAARRLEFSAMTHANEVSTGFARGEPQLFG